MTACKLGVSHKSKPTPVCFLTPLGPPPTYKARGHGDSPRLVSQHQDWATCSSSPIGRWQGHPGNLSKQQHPGPTPPAPGSAPPAGPGLTRGPGDPRPPAIRGPLPSRPPAPWPGPMARPRAGANQPGQARGGKREGLGQRGERWACLTNLQEHTAAPERERGPRAGHRPLRLCPPISRSQPFKTVWCQGEARETTL